MAKGGPRERQFRALHRQRLAAKLASNEAIARAHRLPPGPEFVATTEAQPQHQRPVQKG